MKLGDIFPSKYLKASDLDGRTIVVTIERVELEDLGDSRKPVAYFVGKDRGVVLNRTNCNNIAAVYGDNTDDWIGAEIALFPALVDYAGKSVEAIRVKARPRPAHPAPRKRLKNDEEAALQADRQLDDDMPF